MSKELGASKAAAGGKELFFLLVTKGSQRSLSCFRLALHSCSRQLRFSSGAKESMAEVQKEELF